MRTNEKEILNQMKIIIFDSNIQRDQIDYGTEYSPDSYVHYFIKFKNSDKYILEGKTRQNYISNLETEKALRILTTFPKIHLNNNLIVDCLDVFHETTSINGKKLYLQPFVPLKENSNILFFPELKLLYFSKKIKLMYDNLVYPKLRLDFYRENVTPENFDLKTSELIELIKAPISDLVTISTVVE